MMRFQNNNIIVLLLLLQSLILFESALSYPIDFLKNKSRVMTWQCSYLESDRSIMMGRWRGFHEVAEFTIYYGYDFHADGTFLARHRIYQKELTIQDEFWQGKWEFDGENLTTEGMSRSDPKATLNLRFRLTQDNLLVNEQATSTDPFLPVRLNKQQQN